MKQLTFLPEVKTFPTKLMRDTFSHQQVHAEEARLALEVRYADLLEETDEFNRQLVSFQANKTETLHSWIKYREGFSSGLVELLIEKFGLGPGATVLDPFAGSGTTLLVAQMLGVDAVGIELLPHSYLAWEGKSQVFAYDLAELRAIREKVWEMPLLTSQDPFPHLIITETAFPLQTEQALMGYTRWFETSAMTELARTLCRLILVSILEDVSYTRKDGQYLRWDRRAEKLRQRNQLRETQGKISITGIDKGELPDVKTAFLTKFDKVIADIAELQKSPVLSSRQQLISGNTLYTLPELAPDQFAAVITSPPYANRYDYTRTYALELAYLGVSEDIFKLRQNLLSCTVENKPKLDQLEMFYSAMGQSSRYARILDVIQNNAALTEINAALKVRNARGDINNSGVLTMIAQYFSELTFIFAELHRVCRPGAPVAFVNDNVRYAGEVIPVDLLSTNLAEQVGFEPVKVYVLPQRKGNSSQQMSKFGREALRKSITVWRKA